MLPLILYIPMALALAILLAFALRGIARGGSPERLLPLVGALAAALGISLFLMFGVDERWARWAAVGIAGIIVVPILGPVTLLLISLAIAKLRGKPIRWN